MTRPLVAACLFALTAFALLCGPADGQPPAEKKEPANKFAPPKAMKPDAATLKQIADKTEQLRKAVAELKAKKVPDDVLIEVEIYLKAAENIVRFEEWYAKASGAWALTTLDRGLERAKQAEGGKPVWRDQPGKWVVRAYRSGIDDSIQPYAVLLPHDYGKDPQTKWRLDVVLHGRDSSITEAKFIATHDSSKAAPKDLGYIQLEPYGRGNNAYRWAGEIDVLQAMFTFRGMGKGVPDVVDNNRVVLRGFSMGGAGTWHLGLHRPSQFCVIGPGAGFTTTHGYIKGLPNPLPDYQEKCLRIYDAVDYAENAFNVPVVAYSGANDPQKTAADNIERALMGFKEPLRFTHLIAPGLEHQMPKEWQEKAEAEYRKFADVGANSDPKRVRYVTYTPKYGGCRWVIIDALEKMYEKSVVDAIREGTTFKLTTTNVRSMALHIGRDVARVTLIADGQKMEVVTREEMGGFLSIEKVSGKWTLLEDVKGHFGPQLSPKKEKSRQGPIDDAFTTAFRVIKPATMGWQPLTNQFVSSTLRQFESNWERYFRGHLQFVPADWKQPDLFGPNLVLFGDPQSNPAIAKALPRLPITWTKDELVVNGVKYDSKTHIPILIYPNPPSTGSTYTVINSGHTFKEADLKGTNALLYPRLGDWAVIKPTPTAKDPAAYEVVAAGLFDENWQFPKKK